MGVTPPGKALVQEFHKEGPLLFLVFINDIIDNIKSHIKLFADDTMIYTVVEDPQRAAQMLNHDLNTICEWSQTWLVNFNAIKTKSVLFTTKTNTQPHPTLYFSNQVVTEVDSHIHLGLRIQSNGKWEDHINDIIAKINYKLVVLRKFKHSQDRKTLERIYLTYIRPTMEYSNIIWHNCTQYQAERLEQLQLEAA